MTKIWTPELLKALEDWWDAGGSPYPDEAFRHGYRACEEKNSAAPMSDLQKRLRAYADWLVSCALGNIPEEAATAYEAVSELERLRRELEEARAENDRMRERLQIDPGGGDAIDAAESALAHVLTVRDEYKAENDRLRIKLQEILESPVSQENSYDCFQGIKDIAREAIAKAEGGE